MKLDQMQVNGYLKRKAKRKKIKKVRVNWFMAYVLRKPSGDRIRVEVSGRCIGFLTLA